MATIDYQSAIASAREHKFYQEVALAHELYGIYLIETKNVAEGLEQLKLAIDHYLRVGSTKKAESVSRTYSAHYRSCEH